MNYQDKVVWITGASSGIGEALAIQLSSLGARLILSARSQDKLETIRDGLSNPASARVHVMDVAKIDKIPEEVSKALDIWGTIDVLVNNAGISQRGAVEDTNQQIDQRIFDVNFFGNTCLTRNLLPHMLNNESGRLVIISSVAGKLGPPFRSAYAASKHALHGWYDALRAETAQRGIQVHLICPGYIRTNISLNALDAKGSKHGVMDPGQRDGMTAEQCAKKILHAVSKNKKEVIIGKEWVFVWLRKFLPGLYYRALEKRAAQHAY